MDRKLSQRAAVAVAAAALAAGTSALFGGVAFAGGHSEHTNTGGDGGNGTGARVNCPLPVNVQLPVIMSQSTGDTSQCQTSGGTGGAGGLGARY